MDEKDNNEIIEPITNPEGEVPVPPPPAGDVAQQVAMSLMTAEEGGVLMANGGMTVTEVGIVMPEGSTQEQYESIMAAVTKLQRVSQWGIGDLINQAQRDHGENSVYGFMYPLLASLLGRDEKDPNFQQSMRNLASVARLVKWRTPKLTWSHHREVASLDPENQKAVLTEAVNQKMTVRQIAAFAAKFKQASTMVNADIEASYGGDDSKPTKEKHGGFSIAQATQVIMGMQTIAELEVLTGVIANRVRKLDAFSTPQMGRAIYLSMNEANKATFLAEVNAKAADGSKVLTAIEVAIEAIKQMSISEVEMLITAMVSHVDVSKQNAELELELGGDKAVEGEPKEKTFEPEPDDQSHPPVDVIIDSNSYIDEEEGGADKSDFPF